MTTKAAAWQPAIGARVEVVRGQWSGLVGVVVDVRYNPRDGYVRYRRGTELDSYPKRGLYGVALDGYDQPPLTFARSYLAALQ